MSDHWEGGPDYHAKARFAERSNALLREYTEKLDRMRQEFGTIADAAHSYGVQMRGRPTSPTSIEEYHSFQRRRNLLQERFHSLLPALETMARRISQRIEHTMLEDDVSIEVQLRLAEFEKELQYTNQFFIERSTL